MLMKVRYPVARRKTIKIYEYLSSGQLVQYLRFLIRCKVLHFCITFVITCAWSDFIGPEFLGSYSSQAMYGAQDD